MIQLGSWQFRGQIASLKVVYQHQNQPRKQSWQVYKLVTTAHNILKVDNSLADRTADISFKVDNSLADRTADISLKAD